jgi:hypothetical protein
MIAGFAGLLSAQYQSRTTTSQTTWNGTLVDAECQKTHTEYRESSRQSNPDLSVTTRSETTHRETVDCPATAATSTFGLLTSDGRLIPFDDTSNARVIGFLQSNGTLNRSLTQRAPMRVSVVGTANGGVAVVDTLDLHGGSPETAAGRTVSRGTADVMFDARHDDDQGKLVITATGVHFEDVSDADDSRSWSYAEIKELERKGDKRIEIEPYSGDSFKIQIDGPGMSDAVYQMIADRIVAARTR